MKPRLCLLVRGHVILALALILTLSGRPPAAGARTGTAPVNDFGSSPALIFVENAGQFAAGARFQVPGRDVALWLAEDAIWLGLLDQGSLAASPRRRTGTNVKLSFPGANPHPRLEPFNRLATRVSFFSGDDPAEWRAGVPAWGGVRYVDLYPGIDLELSGEQGQLLPRLSARPGADLSAVRLRVEGAETVSVNDNTLRLTTAAGETAYAWPLLRVQSPSAPAAVRAVGALAFDVISPLVGSAAQLTYAIRGRVTDPGGGGVADVTLLATGGYSAITDASGAYTVTNLLPGTYTLTPALNGYRFAPATRTVEVPPDATGQDFRLVRFEVYLPLVLQPPKPSDLLYGTFLGGSGDAWGTAVAVDASGGIYVTGNAFSADFPITPGAFDTIFDAGDSDAFVVKLNTAGPGLEYATFLGGSGYDFSNGLAVDGSGAAYVTGETGSDDFPTTLEAYDTAYNDNDAFVVKLNAAGSALVYATYLGGRSIDQGKSIAVDGSGAAYVTGQTQSSDLDVTPGAFDTTFDGNYDAFVLKLDAAGSSLAYGTFLGGSGGEDGLGIAVDGSGAAYVTGWTESPDLPTTSNAFDTICGTDGACNQGSDAFVVKLNPAGLALDYGSFLGGSKGDSGTGIAVDGNGSAYVTGWTLESNFPTTPGAFDTSFHGSYDAFVVKLNASGTALNYGTFLGGPDYDVGSGIAVDVSGAAYVTGNTQSGAFPTTPGAFDASLGGYGDAFVARLDAPGSVLEYATFLGGTEYDESYAIAVDGSGVAYIAGGTQSADFPTTPGAFDPTLAGTMNAFVATLRLSGIYPSAVNRH